uniref:Uncharacterized protein n=1 Tax=Talaromyces marneffei PM1 TaxID=1077442 RepID=A0A093VJM6_TALMA
MSAKALIHSGNINHKPMKPALVLNVRNWSTLEETRKEQCLAHISQLSDRAPRPCLSSSASTTPTVIFDYEQEFEAFLQTEQKVHDLLVEEGGIPSHFPTREIESAFDRIKDPRDVENYEDIKDILYYWHTRPGGGRFWISKQLDAWRRFRKYQRDIRQGPRFRIAEYQQQLRRRRKLYGVKGSVRLLVDSNQQSKLCNWVEYQNYHLSHLDDLRSKEQELHTILDNDEFFQNSVQHKVYNDEFIAMTAKKEASYRLALSNKRLGQLQSLCSPQRLTRPLWIASAERELKYAIDRKKEIVGRAILAEKQAENQLRDLERQLHLTNGPQWNDLPETWWNIEIQRREASRNRLHCEEAADMDIALATDLLQAANLDDIHAPTLKQTIREELASAENELKLAIEGLSVIEHENKITKTQNELKYTEERIDTNLILLRWIEKQRALIAPCRHMQIQPLQKFHPFRQAALRRSSRQRKIPDRLVP